MITLLIGKKGSGKTKKLIELANEAVQNSNGNVVVIEKGLKLGEETPGLSGGEAQRLKLASEMGKAQNGSVFVFDEPTIGLHPLDVQTLLTVFQTLIESGATVIVIEHDLDVIRSADYILDMGPGGGEAGGRLVACGTPEQIKNAADSVTGKFI